MIPLAQKRRKLELRTYNYSLLDRLDRPLEYRINTQLRARSAEALYVRPEAFTEATFKPKPLVYPYPHVAELRPEGYHIRVATPWGELLGDWEFTLLGELKGLVVEMRLGGALTSWFVGKSAGQLDKTTVPEPRNRAYRAWAECLTDLIAKHHIPFVRFYAANKKQTEHFERVLRLVPRDDYLTTKLRVQSQRQSGSGRFANSHVFFFTHISQTVQVADLIEQEFVQ